MAKHIFNNQKHWGKRVGKFGVTQQKYLKRRSRRVRDAMNTAKPDGSPPDYPELGKENDLAPDEFLVHD